MWTKENRCHYERRDLRYLSDLTDEDWALLEPLIRKRWPWIKHLLADGAYDRTQLMDKAGSLDFVIKVVRRIDCDPGFKVISSRWVVQRTFGWTRRRRLVRDYE